MTSSESEQAGLPAGPRHPVAAQRSGPSQARTSPTRRFEREALAVRCDVHRIASHHLCGQGQSVNALRQAVRAGDRNARPIWSSAGRASCSSPVDIRNSRRWLDRCRRPRRGSVRDDMDAAAKLLTDPLARADPGTDEITLASERNVRSWMHIYRNDYERAREVQVTAQRQAIAVPRGTLFGSLTGQSMVGLGLALEGRMEAAERTCGEVLEGCQSHGVIESAYADAAALATGVMGVSLYELNDPHGVPALGPRLAQLGDRSLLAPGCA